MVDKLKNPGHDSLALTFSRSGFFGGASASATSAGILVDQYKKVTALITTTMAGSNGASAAGVAATYNPEWSSDGGTTWVVLSEVNGTAITSPTHNPSTVAVARAYVYPAAHPLFRMRISAAGAAATGVSADVRVSLTP